MAEGRERVPAPLLDEAGPSVVIDVTVGDEDAPDLVEAPAQRPEPLRQRRGGLLGAVPGVHQQEPALGVLDGVGVHRPARLGERDGDGDPVDPERGQVGLAQRDAFTLAASAGSAWNRSATSP